jgi:EpsI family protein
MAAAMLRNAKVLTSLGLLVLLGVYALAFPPVKLVGTRLDTCPMELGGMPGTELTLEQTVLDDLDPDDYLVRQYDRADGVPVWLVIVYFQNARLGAHDPQICYRSQGFRVEDLPSGSVATAGGPLPYRSFVAMKGRRREVVRDLWFTAGGALADVKGWRDRMFFQGLRDNRSFGAFVRVSTLDSGDMGTAERAITEVMRDLAPRLPGFFPTDRASWEVRP